MPEHNTNRHQLRKQLIVNGYRPLPLLDKGIRITGWTREDITEEWLAQFARVSRFNNTGIRCDDLIAFDVDVLDEDLADEIEDFIENECGPTDLCRVGRWPKRLLLYRAAADVDRSARTGKYGGHQVELLTTHGRQFAAFGKHPGTGEEYEWLDGISPATTPYADLPELSPEGAMQCLNALDDLLAATGLEKSSPGGRRGVEGVNQYDLTDDFPVMLTDGTRTTWGELKGTLDGRGVFGNLKRENGEWGDSDGVHFYKAAGVGEPCIHDFARDTTHWDKRVNDQLAAAMPPPPPGPTMFGMGDDMRDMQENYVLLADKTVRHVDHPEHVFSIDGFALINAHKTVPAPTNRNPAATTPLVAEWVRHVDTLRADRAALRPDYPDDVVVREGRMRVFNTYNPPAHHADGGEVATLLEFAEHLIPNPIERDLFLDWNALKVAHPAYRMHGLVTVTPTHGTGRGTWIQIMQKLLGLAYVNEVELADLIGEGGQAQFNEFMATSLLVYVPEALEEKEERSKWQSRHVSYERLKMVCDPIAARIYVKRKYGKNSTEWTYASVLISSNHVDALAIEPGDRRLIVLDNTEVSIYNAPDDLYMRIHRWQEQPRNIAALHAWMLQRAEQAQYKPFVEPPMTNAKARMIEAGQSDLDTLFDAFATDAAGSICTLAQWRRFAYQARVSGDYDLPIGDRLDAALVSVLKKRGRRIIDSKSGNMKVDGTVIRPWIIRDFERWKGSTDGLQIRAELKKNGDPGAQVAKI